MSEWQPIETAPKDGTTIIGWCTWFDEPCTVAWQHDMWVAIWDGSRVLEYQSDFGSDYKGGDPVTHWMPLPEPPR